ncbi:MAG: ribonuclease HII [Verrucomicrobia bacterium]|nr:ribonuclease HII [Verrucomicrobiota bacterium]
MGSIKEDRFLYERKLLEDEKLYPIAGVDEAGRGPLAGPVTVAAVILPKVWIKEGMPESLREVNDSKKLSEVVRERLYNELQAHPEVIKSVVMLSSEQIDQLNILRATHQGMLLALEGLVKQGCVPQHVLVDGCDVKAITYPHTALVKGDAKSYSIAAASILAKVERDHVMMEYDKQWPEYGFAQHKGYGTEIHRAALKKYGLCPIHRRTFVHLEEQGELNLF